MKQTGWRTRLLETTRGRILESLRSKEGTVNELAAALRLTDNAIRAHLLSLERDGLIEQTGKQAGVRKPHAMYALTPAAEQIFPKAYGPLLDLVMTVISRKLSSRELRAAMREVGREVAARHRRNDIGNTREQRIEAALRILNELGGAASFEKSNGQDVIRGRGCPLSAATSHHPEACLIAESLLAEVIGTQVKQRCLRGEAPSCCFQLA